jgi:hypothetical protein
VRTLTRNTCPGHVPTVIAKLRNPHCHDAALRTYLISAQALDFLPFEREEDELCSDESTALHILKSTVFPFRLP